MNRFFRVVFDESKAQWVVVSEMAKASGKKSGVVGDLSAHHSHLNSLSRFSGSLKQGLWRFAPVSLAIWGIFATPAQAAVFECKQGAGGDSVVCGWTNEAQGNSASAIGKENKANEMRASAIGYGNTAGFHATALGNTNDASGNYSSAVGYWNNATSKNSYAFGGQNNLAYDRNNLGISRTMGDNAVALGYQNNYSETEDVTVGTGSIAVGVKNTASGQYSSAMGYSNTASGKNSSAFGYTNKAEKEDSTAVGRGNTASGLYAQALGRSNQATQLNTVAVGDSNKATNQFAVAMGRDNTANANVANAVGALNTASGQYSSAFGYSNSAYGEHSSAFGKGNTAGNANNSGITQATAVGILNIASGSGSSAFGLSNQAINSNTVAIGQSNTAGSASNSNVTYATAVGISNEASGTYSSAMGNQNTASGQNSSAVGYNNTASGQYSSAFGAQSVANADKSIALGYQSVANDRSANTQGAAFAPDLSNLGDKEKAVWVATSGIASFGNIDAQSANQTPAPITRQITGVAAGSDDTDAVNVAQLNAAVRNSGSGVCSYDSTNGILNCGDNNTVTGTQHIAVLGMDNTVKGGHYASLFGHKNNAEGAASSAFGHKNTATGDASVALGHLNTAQGNYSVTAGSLNNATGERSIVLGSGYESPYGPNNDKYNLASGTGAIIIGSTYVDSNTNTAITNTASADYSIVLGAGGTATQNGGVALGVLSNANRAAWDSGNNNYNAAFVPTDIDNLTDTQKAAWRATSGILAVGDPDNLGQNGAITRQITGVAAGSDDTDAVNVAQLNAAVKNANGFTGITVEDNNQQGIAVSGSLKLVGDGNIQTQAAGDTVTFSLSDNVGVKSMTVGEPTSGTVTITGNSIKFNPAVKANGMVELTSTSLDMGGNAITGVLTNDQDESSAVSVKYLNTALQNAGSGSGVCSYAANGALVCGSGHFTANGSAVTPPNNSITIGTQNNVNIGSGSLKVGNNAVAVGYQNNYFYDTNPVRVGENSTAVGVGNQASGNYSAAVGYSNIVSDTNSAALGVSNTVVNVGNSHYQGAAAIGVSNQAVAEQSVAVGMGNQATAQWASAMGVGNYAKGNLSSAFGLMNDAYTDGSVALGNSNTAGDSQNAKATNAVAVGANNTASNLNSSAFGVSSTAVVDESTALGYRSYANRAAGDSGYSPVIGAGSSDSSAVWKSTSGVLAVGDPDNLGQNGVITRQITGVAAGSAPTDAVNVAQLRDLRTLVTQQTGAGVCSYDNATGALVCGNGHWTQNSGVAVTPSNNSTTIGTENNISVSGSLNVGKNAVAVGYRNNYNDSSDQNIWDTTVGDNSTAVGVENRASGLNSSAVGYGNNSTSSNSHTFGGENNVSVSGYMHMGQNAVALGYRNNYLGTNGMLYVGENSTAVGYENTASGRNSSAMGHQNTASGGGSTAVGDGNTASNIYSVAMGYENKASNLASVAMGYRNETSGEGSSAVGLGNTASGEVSSAVGYGNTASGLNSSAVGYHNNSTSNNSHTFGGENNVSVSVSGSLKMGANAVAVGYRNNYNNGLDPNDLDITVGDNSTAVGVENRASGFGSSAVGIGNKATAQYSSAFGTDSTAAVDYGTAIGYRSYADRADLKSTNEKGLYAPADFGTLDEKGQAIWQSTSAALAVGDPAGTGNRGTPITRQITGVAAGSQDTDAVNVAQLNAAVKNSGSGVCSYDSGTGALVCGNGHWQHNSGVAVTPSDNSTTIGTENNASVSGSLNVGINAVAVGYRNNYNDGSDPNNMDTTVGSYSSAVGGFNKASGVQSSAFGLRNQASAQNSSAFGFSNEASGTDSSAFGNDNEAIGDFSSAFGLKNKASGEFSSVFGVRNNAYTDGSVALGITNQAGDSQNPNAIGATAVGVNNTASGSYSTAVGFENNVSGLSASAFGYQNVAMGNVSSAVGYMNNAYTGGSVALGYSNKAGDSQNADAQHAVAVGVSNTASGRHSSAIGFQNTASGPWSSAIGYYNQATKEYAAALGNYNTADADNATAVGYRNTASGVGSAALGAWNKAEGKYSLAVGRSSKALVDNSIAIGFGSYADRGAGVVGYSPSNTDYSQDNTGVWKATDGAMAVGANYVGAGGQILHTRQITGVAAGSADTDAVNVAQLKEVNDRLGDYATQTDLTAVGDRLTTAEQDIVSLKTGLSNAEKNITDLQSDLSAVDSRVAVVETNITDLQNNVKDINAQFNDYATIAKLEAEYTKTTDMNTAIDKAKNAAVTAANDYTDQEIDALKKSGQVYSPIAVSGDKGNGFSIPSGGSVAFVGDGKNITTTAENDQVEIALNKDIQVDSVNAGGTVVNQNGVALPSGVALTNGGLNNGGQVISNVAAGVRPTDAVNVAQLNNAMAQSEGRLSARIDRAEKRANAGAAAAMATGNLQNAARPGANSFSISGATFAGESGYAMGYSTMSSDGKWGFNAFGNGDSRGRFGGGASVGFHW